MRLAVWLAERFTIRTVVVHKQELGQQLRGLNKAGTPASHRCVQIIYL